MATGAVASASAPVARLGNERVVRRSFAVPSKDAGREVVDGADDDDVPVALGLAQGGALVAQALHHGADAVVGRRERARPLA